MSSCGTWYRYQIHTGLYLIDRFVPQRRHPHLLTCISRWIITRDKSSIYQCICKLKYFHILIYFFTFVLNSLFNSVVSIDDGCDNFLLRFSWATPSFSRPLHVLCSYKALNIKVFRVSLFSTESFVPQPTLLPVCN